MSDYLQPNFFIIIFIEQMNRKTIYMQRNPHKKLQKILRDMTQIQIEHSNKHLRDMLSKKKAKLKEIYSLRSHQVLQTQMRPTKNSYPEFMSVLPACIGQEFISQKIKNDILRPERFYSSQPNVKGGAFVLPKKSSLIENRKIVNAQFSEYSRIVDEQSGQVKHKRLLHLLASHQQMFGNEKNKHIRMKKTLFQKFMPDKYHLYNNPISLKKSTAFQSSGLQRSRSKYMINQQIINSQRSVQTIQISELSSSQKYRKLSVPSKQSPKSNINSLPFQKVIDNCQ